MRCSFLLLTLSLFWTRAAGLNLFCSRAASSSCERSLAPPFSAAGLAFAPAAPPAPPPTVRLSGSSDLSGAVSRVADASAGSEAPLMSLSVVAAAVAAAFFGRFRFLLAAVVDAVSLGSRLRPGMYRLTEATTLSTVDG